MSATLTQPVLPATQASPKHLQGSYTLPDGSTRVLYAQRVLGHVRLTDEPEHPGKGARAYLIERCVEADPVADGTSASAHLSALVADYLDQARRLQACPLGREALLTEAHASTMLAPKAEKASPFSVMVKYGVNTWPEAIAARAAANKAAKEAAKQQSAPECPSCGCRYTQNGPAWDGSSCDACGTVTTTSVELQAVAA